MLRIILALALVVVAISVGLSMSTPARMHPTLSLVAALSTAPSGAGPVQPTVKSIAQPTSVPTAHPTAQPTAHPTTQPTAHPTAQPTLQPTAQPTGIPCGVTPPRDYQWAVTRMRTLDTDHLLGLVEHYFGQWTCQAMAVIDCESHWNPTAWNTTYWYGGHASGVFQIIYPTTWQQTWVGQVHPTQQDAFNPALNIQAAWVLFSTTHDWRLWACQPTNWDTLGG